MPSEQSYDSVENGSSESIGDAALKLLLQQHRSLLLSMLVSRTMGRAMNMLLIVFIIVDMMVSRAGNSIAPYHIPVATMLVAIFIACIWESERHSLSARVAALERTLGKKSQFRFESAFIDYRFEISSRAYKFRLLRIEPLLWLVIVAGVTTVRFISYGGFR